MLLPCGIENLPQFPALNTDAEPGAVPKPRAKPRFFPSLPALTQPLESRIFDCKFILCGFFPRKRLSGWSGLG